MKIEDQVCDRLQGKRLLNLGITADAHIYHYQEQTPKNPNMHYYGYPQEQMPWRIYLTGKPSRISTNSTFAEDPAFTAAELGVMLPEDCTATRVGYNNWQAYGPEINLTSHVIYDQPTEAIAKAQLLIWLLENNHVTAEECNQQLKQA